MPPPFRRGDKLKGAEPSIPRSFTLHPFLILPSAGAWRWPDLLLGAGWGRGVLELQLGMMQFGGQSPHGFVLRRSASYGSSVPPLSAQKQHLQREAPSRLKSVVTVICAIVFLLCAVRIGFRLLRFSPQHLHHAHHTAITAPRSLLDGGGGGGAALLAEGAGASTPANAR